MPLSSLTHSQSTIRSSSDPSTDGAWQIKLLYDGDCPLCLREVNFLKRRDAGQGRVAFVNIAADDYNPAEHGGIDYETAMGRIHAVLPDGSVLKNMEVFRRIYSILGMGWVYAATRWPIIGPVVDWLYERWADSRLALTGRPSLDVLMQQRQQSADCASGDRCRLTPESDAIESGDQVMPDRSN